MAEPVTEQGAGVVGYEPKGGEGFRMTAQGGLPLFAQAAVTKVVVAPNVMVTVKVDSGS